MTCVRRLRLVLAMVLALACALLVAPPAPGQSAGAIPASREAKRVAVLPITGPIDQVSLWSLERRLRSASEQGFDAVVLEIDTPGGEVGAMLDILLRLKSEAPVNTVAWIRPKAFSAGTFIALACREIVVAPGSVFGDAAPIAAVPGMGIVPLPAAERAKQESPLLDELDDAAARLGHDPRLLQAFVAVERELWLVERSSDGARRFADRAELESLGLDPASAPLPTKAPPGAPAPKKPLLPSAAPLSDDGSTWRIVETIDTADRLLVVQSDEAIRWGLASAEVRDDEALRAFFAADTTTRFPESWTEPVVRLLVSWPMRILLIAIFVVALVIESLHPGIGVAGAIAGVALLLLVGAPGILGLAQWWEILLVVAGIALVGVEILVLPGTGFVGIAGGVCILGGLVASFTGTDPTSASQRSMLLTATTTTLAGIVLGAIGVWFASRWMGESRVMRRAVLSASVRNTDEPPPRHDAKVPAPGTTGVADTDLRPSGRARFGDDILDAQSSGDYIPRGAAIVATGRQGATVLVERADGPAPQADVRT
ncbi:MAG: NfeD family protein [Planctomycetota bacterium]